MENREEALKLIAEADRLRVSGHIWADGDAVGSVIGFCEAARDAGKDVQGTFSPVPVSRQFRYLETRTVVTPEEIDVQPGDVCVVFDTATPDRLPKPVQEKFLSETLIVADHHLTGEGYGTHQIVDPTAASAAEIAFGIVDELGWDVSPASAKGFYAGVVTDSGRFGYSSVKADTLMTGAGLIILGADPEEAVREIYEQESFGYFKLLSDVLERMGMDEDRGLVWSYADDDDLKKHGITWDDTMGMINTIRLTRGSTVAVMFRYTQGMLKFSLRSRGDIDVSRIAVAFGGGGHRNAAAARLKEASMRDVLPKIREMIDMQRRN